MSALAPDATLTDDGNRRSLTDRIDREIFSVHSHLTVEHEQEQGLHLLARERNDTSCEMPTYWRLRAGGDKIRCINTGQA
jgi:hypothetical protein